MALKDNKSTCEDKKTLDLKALNVRIPHFSLKSGVFSAHIFHAVLADVSCSSMTQKYNDQSIINPAWLLFFTKVETDGNRSKNPLKRNSNLTAQWTRFQTQELRANIMLSAASSAEGKISRLCVSMC